MKSGFVINEFSIIEYGVTVFCYYLLIGNKPTFHNPSACYLK